MFPSALLVFISFQHILLDLQYIHPMYVCLVYKAYFSDLWRFTVREVMCEYFQLDFILHTITNFHIVHCLRIFYSILFPIFFKFPNHLTISIFQDTLSICKQKPGDFLQETFDICRRSHMLPCIKHYKKVMRGHMQCQSNYVFDNNKIVLENIIQ